MVRYFVLMVFFAMFFIIFNQSIISLYVTNVSFVDELLLLLSVFVIVIFNFKKFYLQAKLDKFFIAFIAYLLFQIVNILNSQFSIDFILSFLQAFISIKFFLILFALVILFDVRNKHDRFIFKLLFNSCVALFLIGFVLNLIIQESWNLFFNADIAYRYGFIRMIGWFSNTAHNAYFFIFLLTLFVFKKYFGKPFSEMFLFKKLILFIVIDFITSYILSVRKGLFLLLPLSYYSYRDLSSLNKLIFILFFAVFISVFYYFIRDLPVVFDTINDISNFFHDDDNLYTRGLFVYHGFNLGLEFFPFGTGPATYGTVLSNFNTLEVYNYVGLNLGWFTREDGMLKGVYDSNIISIFAENGFFGMIFIFILGYFFFQKSARYLVMNCSLVYKMFIIFTILVSITDPVFQDGMFTCFFALSYLFLVVKSQSLGGGNSVIPPKNKPS